MKKVSFLTVALATILLTSCGGSSSENTATETPKEVILKAAQTEIKGDLKGCYELVDKNYKVKVDEYYGDDLLMIELSRTEQALPYDRDNVVIFPEGKESTAEYCAGFGVEILDANGDVIDKQDAKMTPYSWNEMTAALHLLSGETTTIRFYFDDLTSAASIRVTSIVLPNDKKPTAVEEVAEAVTEAAENSDDVDVEAAAKALETAGDLLEAEMEVLNALGGL